jgi:hypothetical protein
MQKPRTITPGDVVQMRKAHACGGNEWTVLSTGMDIRVRCGRCGRTILMPRTQFERAVKQVISGTDEGKGSPGTRPEDVP